MVLSRVLSVPRNRLRFQALLLPWVVRNLTLGQVAFQGSGYRSRVVFNQPLAMCTTLILMDSFLKKKLFGAMSSSYSSISGKYGFYFDFIQNNNKLYYTNTRNKYS